MYRPKYFKVQFTKDGKKYSEIAPPEILNNNWSDDLILFMFDERLLKLTDRIREIYGPIYINNYSAGLCNCGFRIDKNGVGIKDNEGAEISQHKFGRAFDLHIISIENKKLDRQNKIKAYNEVRKQLLNNKEFDLLRFENNVWWLHIDVRNSQLRTFNP